MAGVIGRVRTSELAAHVGEKVTAAGWLHTRRRLGGVTFAILRDGWGLCQLVSQGGNSLPDVATESVVTATGVVIAEPKAPGGVELHDCTWQLISPAETPPLTLGKRELRAAQATLLDMAAVSLRHPTRRCVFRVAAAMIETFRQTLRDMAFTEIATPKILGGATEGGANAFRLDYFGRPAFLAQSPQLYKQMLVGVFERVFEVGPVFRAEPHDTTRHLNQYTSLDAEMGFIVDHQDVMALVESVVVNMVEGAEECARFLELTGQLSVGWQQLLQRPFPSIPFWEAQRLIQTRFGRDVTGEDDLSPQDERDLGQWARDEYNSDFLFVTGYPLRKRPFYTYPDPNHPGYSNSFDLLFRGVEIVTGGQRLHTYADYVNALTDRGINPTPFEGYLQAFRYGMPPHGGFGMGLERFVTQLLGLANVREAALFPRTMTRLEP